jgi:hypothetical protein
MRVMTTMSETFFGSTKEFSSITLEEVSTVFVDPDNRELSPNPSIETLRFTFAVPKIHKLKNTFS